MRWQILFLGPALLPAVCAQHVVAQLGDLLFADASYEMGEESAKTIWETDIFTAPCTCTESATTNTYSHISSWSSTTTVTVSSEQSTETTSTTKWSTTSLPNIFHTSQASSYTSFVITPSQEISISTISPSVTRSITAHPSSTKSSVDGKPTSPNAVGYESWSTPVSPFFLTSVTEAATFTDSPLTTTVKINPTVSGANTTLTAKTTETETVLYNSTISVETTTAIAFPYGTPSYPASPITSVSSSSTDIIPSSRTPSGTTHLSSEGPRTVTSNTTINAASPTISSSYSTPPSTLSICPSRIVNPTYTVPTPLPTDYTWGCPPGYLCHPKNTALDGECNFEAGPPADTYYCSPDECIPVPPLHPPQYPTSNKTEKYIVSPGYFNLNPTEFGLDYGIFTFPNGSSVEDGQEEQRYGQYKGKKRQFSSSIIPGLCYDQCNNCMVEAQQMGKTPLLCQSGSQFKIQLDLCNVCVNSNWDAIIAIGGLLPPFRQFLDYCGTTSSQPRPQPEPGHSTRGTSKPETATSLSKGAPASTEASKTESPSAPTLTTSSMPKTTETGIEPTTTPKAHRTADSGSSTVPTESRNRAITTTSSAESISSTESTAQSATGAASIQAPITASASGSSSSFPSSDSSSRASVTHSENTSSQFTSEAGSAASQNQPSIVTSTSLGDRIESGSSTAKAEHASYSTSEKGTGPASATGTGTGEMSEPGTGTTVSRTGPRPEAPASRGSSETNAAFTNISDASPTVPNNGETGNQQTTSTPEPGLIASSGLQAQAPSGELPNTSSLNSSPSLTPNAETPRIHPTATVAATRAITTAAGSGSGIGSGASYSILTLGSSSFVGIPPTPTPTPSLFEGKASLTIRSSNISWLFVVLCGFLYW